MPALPPDLLKSSFYLYRSRRDAEHGANYGGTGFFVGIMSNVDRSKSHPIAVSNWHVAVDGGYSIIRVNKKEGGVDIFEFDPSEWTFRPRWHDLAVIPIEIDDNVHDVAVMVDLILMPRGLDGSDYIAIGDDVFMVGRFMDHDGGQTNEPAVRFGHISMLPTKIRQPTGALLESYVIDVHSRTGYSGSPVFVYRTLASNLSDLFSSTDLDFGGLGGCQAA